MRYPRCLLIMMGRLGIGHSPCVHASGGIAGECRACPRDRQPVWTMFSPRLLGETDEDHAIWLARVRRDHPPRPRPKFDRWV